MKNEALIRIMKEIPKFDAVLKSKSFQIRGFELMDSYSVPAFRLEIFYEPGPDAEPGNKPLR